jgi:hypothetical protein
MDTPLTTRRLRYSFTNLSVAKSNFVAFETDAALDPVSGIEGVVVGSVIETASRPN